MTAIQIMILSAIVSVTLLIFAFFIVVKPLTKKMEDYFNGTVLEFEQAEVVDGDTIITHTALEVSRLQTLETAIYDFKVAGTRGYIGGEEVVVFGAQWFAEKMEELDREAQ